MAIGISTCCVRNIQRAHLAPRNFYFEHPQPASSQHGSRSRIRREMHATSIRRTFSASRKSHDPMTLDVMFAGQKDFLTRGGAPSTQIRHLSAKSSRASRSFGSVEPQQTAVAIKSSQQEPATRKKEHLRVATYKRRTSQSMEMAILMWLLKEKHLVLHSSSLHQNVFNVSIQVECSIKDTGETIQVEGVGSSPTEAKGRADWLLISELKKSGAWNRLRLADARLQSVLHDGNEPHFHQLQKFWAKKYFALDWVMSRTIDDERTFSIFCTIPGVNKYVVAEVRDREERNLDIKASLLLISILQKKRFWNRWIDKCSSEIDSLDTLKTRLEIDPGDESNLPFSDWTARAFPGVKTEVQTALDEAVLEGKCKLDISTTWSSTDDYTSTLIFIKGTEEVHATTQSQKMKTAASKAYFLLIHMLHVTRGWEGVVPHAKLMMDDDLLQTMVHTRQALLEAGTLVQQECSKHPTNASTGKGMGYWSTKSKENRLAELRQSLTTIDESQDPRALAFRSKRAEMRVNERKQKVLDLINQNTYSIIVAETGSGKSSQIPQIILNDAIEKNEALGCRVLCVQPRRLAAQMLAKRVAEERFEDVGNTVGCIVRGSHKALQQGGTITYCTTGIFLRMLETPDRLFKEFSHIMLDEVHERDLNIDSAMLILKHHIASMQDTTATDVNTKSSSVGASGSDKMPKAPPKVIVSSATVDVNLFASYFGNKQSDGTVTPAPHISIPGRQYPVQKHFLDEILEDLMKTFSPKALAPFLQEKETKRFLAEHYAQFDETEPPQANTQEGIDDKAVEVLLPEPTALIETGADPLIPFGLVVAQIFQILKTTQSGSIIVFLPGLHAMANVQFLLGQLARKAEVEIFNQDRFRILTLHSQRPEEMEKLSHETPPGCRRILLSTDIAEASVTIPDLKYVIDSGRVNQANFESNSMTLEILPHWISVSSASQRAGRAGRVQAGDYFFLGTKRRFDTLRITKAPEILRGNLDMVCLRAREVAPQIPLPSFFRLAIESPSEEKVQSTISGLQKLRALDLKENLTRVGSMLVNLPLEPNFGKLVLLGVVFRCLEPLVILSLLRESEIFYRGVNPEEQKLVFQKRLSFSQGLNSDQISNLNGYKAVQNVMIKQGHQKAYDFACSNYLYFPVFRDVFSNAKQLINALKKQNIVARSTPILGDDGHLGGAELNANSKDTQLIKALLLFCLSPRIVAPTFASTLQRTPFMNTSTETDALTGSRSLNKKLLISGDLAFYQQKLQLHSGNTMLPDTTVISPLLACLFSSKTLWKKRRLLVDSWLSLALDLKNSTETPETVGSTVRTLSSVIDTSIQRAIHALGISSMSVPAKDFKPGQRKNFLQTREMFNEVLQSSLKELLMRDMHRAEPRDVTTPTLPRDLQQKPWGEIYA